MGGSITVESIEGLGSNFIFSIPFTKSGKKIVESTSNYQFNPIDIGDIRILVAEDNQMNTLYIMRILGKHNIQADHVPNGQKAVEYCKNNKYNLILMDIRMPVMDGLEATRRLKADAQLALIPIITLTALAMTGDRERCLEAGANEYMSKPVSPVKLVEIITSCLN